MVSCGISTPFGVLSPCERQIAHALLTRPPLESPVSTRRLPQVIPARLACVRHAASVRPEPGSNSYVQSLNTVLSNGFKLKLLTVVLCVSLICIVFKVRCSQASLYIIAPFYFGVNGFLHFYKTFLHKIIFINIFISMNLYCSCFYAF